MSECVHIVSEGHSVPQKAHLRPANGAQGSHRRHKHPANRPANGEIMNKRNVPLRHLCVNAGKRNGIYLIPAEADTGNTFAVSKVSLAKL